MLPTTSTSSLAYFPPKQHTLSSNYVKATHTTASSTDNSTQASNGNYDSLYTRLPTNQFVSVAPLLIFLMSTSSNAHASAKLASTMLFAMALPMLWHQFSPPQDLSPQTQWLTRNPTFTSHLTLTLVRLTSPLTFDPYPAPPPLTSHGCTSHTVGAGITISPLPPRLPLHPNSPHVLHIITANPDSHLQK